MGCLKVSEKIVLPRTSASAFKFSSSIALAQLETKLLWLLVAEVVSLPR